ncbi:MAG TPA: CPBP family intramembrane glutamic endopeptidase [Chitinophagaceae bacterium]|nr:CPBP family intramembrane glutamic endopeptidase [Chitinophagaceae bacterium]
MAIKLKNQPPGVHFAVFFGLTVGMILVNLLVNDIFFSKMPNIFTDRAFTAAELNKYKWFQFVSTIMIFGIPPIVYGIMSDEQPMQYLGVKRSAHAGFLFFTILLLVAVQPMAMVLGEWNQHANFGSEIRKLEDASNKAMTRFLVMHSPTDLLINLLVVAVLPATVEELFFRGGLQNILERWTQRPVIAITLSSLLFSLFHLSFYKILPIFLLGAVLGTLFYITRNLWYSIFFHFVNNTMALLANYYAQRNEFMKKLADDDVQLSWWVGLISLVITVALFYLLRRRFPYKPLDRAWLQNSFNNEFNNPR